MALLISRIEFTTTGFEGTGLTVITAESSSFAGELAKFPHQVPAAYSSLLQYSIIVRNDSQRDVDNLTYRYRILRPDGTGGIRIITPNSFGRDPTERSMLRPGDRYLLTPVLDKMTLAEMESALTVHISLDSAIFSDGEIVGPDESREMQRENDAARARMDLAREIRGLDHSKASEAVKLHIKHTRDEFYRNGLFDVYTAEKSRLSQDLTEGLPVDLSVNTPHIWRKK